MRTRGLQLELAENWQRIDAQTFIFDLRRNITFHNGQPLTAADVKFTYESILQAKNLSPKRARLKPLQAIDQLGPYRLRFRLAAPHAPFLEHFTIGIVPQVPLNDAMSSASPPVGLRTLHVGITSVGRDGDLEGEPVLLGRETSARGLVFKVVPGRHGAGPRIQERKHRFSAERSGTRRAPPGSSTTPTRGHRSPSRHNVSVHRHQPQSPHSSCTRRYAKRWPMRIDRESIIRHLIKDLGTPASGLLSPLNWAYEGTVNQCLTIRRRRNTCWMRLDSPIPDGDGPRPRFKLSFKSTNLDLRRRIAEALKEQLAARRH